ncbi:MAG: NUDIX hydrolase [Pseudomonadota bacterium]
MTLAALRTAIRAEIANIVPFDDTENTAITETLAWVDSGAEIFRLQKPATPPKHLVSYFLVVDGEHILLVDHIKAGLWLPTGGHVEPGEHPRETVEREIVEELGIEAEFLSPSPIMLTATTTVGQMPGHVDVSLWYVVEGDRTISLQFDGTEFHQVQWFHRDAVPFDRADPELGRVLAKLETQGLLRCGTRQDAPL